MQIIKWMSVFVQLKLFGASVNIVYLEDTMQSSTKRLWGPSLATDGDISQSTPYCTHTSTNQNSYWWAVDLGAVFTIDSVTIYNREYCCASRLYDFSVLVYDPAIPTWTTFRAGPGLMCYFHNGQCPSILNLSCDNRTVGRYLLIYKKGRWLSIIDALTLCEVQVYATNRRSGTMYCKQTPRVALLHLGTYTTTSNLECAMMCDQRENCLGFITKPGNQCSLYQTSKTVATADASEDYHE